MEIEPINFSTDHAEWLRMRLALWPDSKLQIMESEMQEIGADPKQQVFVLRRPEGGLGGFIEVSLRPWADGCDTRPVGYIEGWYVDPDLRRSGVGGALVQAAERWAAAQRCTEMASDCEDWNTVSFQAHLALGYAEVNRIIQFRKSI
jgi:aminoglycoside 6'-N-acetyltransferase I